MVTLIYSAPTSPTIIPANTNSQKCHVFFAQTLVTSHCRLAKNHDIRVTNKDLSTLFSFTNVWPKVFFPAIVTVPAVSTFLGS